MAADKEKVIQLAKKKGDNADLFLLDIISEMSAELSRLSEEIKKDTPEDAKIDKVATRLATRLAILEKGEKGDSVQGEKGGDGKDGKDGKNGKDGKDAVAKDGNDGTDGADGQKGEKGENGTDGAPDMAEDVRNKLELLDGEDRLDKKFIKGFGELEKEIEELKKRPIGRGGGTSAIGVAQTFKYIAHTEAPTGDIDGANTTYTVKVDIWWIAGFTLNGENIAELPNYTFANKVITFSTALPAAYSGKDFEVKYIG